MNAADWNVAYIPDAGKDMMRLDNSQRLQVRKALEKVRKNPLPVSEGGYGKPLGGSLTGLLKIKLRSQSLRVVYRLIYRENTMEVLVVGVRTDDRVYTLAVERLRQLS